MFVLKTARLVGFSSNIGESHPRFIRFAKFLSKIFELYTIPDDRPSRLSFRGYSLLAGA